MLFILISINILNTRVSLIFTGNFKINYYILQETFFWTSKFKKKMVYLLLILIDCFFAFLNIKNYEQLKIPIIFFVVIILI